MSFDVSEGTWMSLDLSPDGQTIVFELRRDPLPAAGPPAGAQRPVDPRAPIPLATLGMDRSDGDPQPRVGLGRRERQA